MDIETDRICNDILNGTFDLSCIGFSNSLADRSHHYYCTPKDAQIIGSLGVDGIHYCTLPSFGTKIFIVSPLPFDTHHVIPIAEDFLTFLYLISYFRGTQLLDQIPYTEKAKIETMMRKKKEKESLEQKEILQRICMITKNVVFPEDPYEYVIRLYKNFPYEKIEYTERYYQIIAE